MRYFLKEEIHHFSSRDRALVILFDKVLDLTYLLHTTPQVLTASLQQAAGTDISHWFKSTGELPVRSFPSSTPVTPDNLWMLHVHDSDGNVLTTPVANPWWNDGSLVIGKLTSRPRSVTFINMLTHDRHTIKVADEEVLLDIAQRLTPYNSHCTSYTWKFNGKELDMNLSLTNNGIPDLEAELDDLGLNPDDGIPVICLYFNDDLSVA
ncbi:hypothetical protein GEMRC1_009256 [Eukaryota sp. GEM-RC1]